MYTGKDTRANQPRLPYVHDEGRADDDVAFVELHENTRNRLAPQTRGG
jgi:hypothetical protein